VTPRIIHASSRMSSRIRGGVDDMSWVLVGARVSALLGVDAKDDDRVEVLVWDGAFGSAGCGVDKQGAF